MRERDIIELIHDRLHGLGDLGVVVNPADVRIDLALDGDLDGEQKAQLLKLTERYCVIFQTLSKPPRLALNVTRA